MNWWGFVYWEMFANDKSLVAISVGDRKLLKSFIVENIVELRGGWTDFP